MLDFLSDGFVCDFGLVLFVSIFGVELAMGPFGSVFGFGVAFGFVCSTGFLVCWFVRGIPTALAGLGLGVSLVLFITSLPSGVGLAGIDDLASSRDRVLV